MRRTRAASRAVRTRRARIDPDGRVQRGERSRAAIVQAMFELVGSGVVEPTAQQVAERAEVGLRSVFRHFRDMDGLYAELAARLRTEVVPMLLTEPASGDLATRARALVATRVRLYERIAPYKRASNVHRARSPFLSAGHAALVAELAAALPRWLPELASRPEALRDALELVTSFEAWDRLRSDQRLSRERAQAALAHAVLSLVTGAS